MSPPPLTRRALLRAGLGAGAAIALSRPLTARAVDPARANPLFRISLAQWSYHRAVQSGAMTIMDFPAGALNTHQINAVEYVSTLFPRRKLADEAAELRRRCDDLAVRSLLIMVDGDGALGDPDPVVRSATVDNHMKWLDAAKALGCHAIRVNAESRGNSTEQERLAADGLRSLCERADGVGLSVLVENHWGLSSDPNWLMAVMRRVAHPRVGTLPDFGNFPTTQDRYAAVEAMMPLARAVSAKSNDFNAAGDESSTDYRRMLRIVAAAGYNGYVGIEYEGSRLSERDGVEATKSLLERVRAELEKQRDIP